ncbi:hypothetical protein HS088_TW21G00628 [Tripterygium wilfordii]|uniref:ABC-2 type transporter transmembrane domain-containing protein n=1 Tax=Tripterygium wilfordii TaxID=458696 RepID=A0A7J7C2V0_TRIWF|nr:hypothetical protein HS088_TW21G00628 [Tripterygium wilfordii]
MCFEVSLFTSVESVTRIAFWSIPGWKDCNHNDTPAFEQNVSHVPQVIADIGRVPCYYGKARESIEYFSSLRFIPEIAMNPAELLLDLATGQVKDISIPDDLLAAQGTGLDSERTVIKYLQLKYKTKLEPKEKAENHRNTKAPEHLQLAIQVKKDWTLSWITILYLHFLDICINLRSSIRIPIRKDLSGERKESRHVSVYFMAGFKRTVPCFFLTLFAILLIAITSQGAGELLGAAALSIKRAGMIASLILMLFLLTGGYYVQTAIESVILRRRVLHYYECESHGGCRTLQSSPSFDTENLKDGLQEVWVLLAMALGFRLCAYFALKRRINVCHL